MIENISVITLGVEEFGKSLEFYSKVLGWETTASENDPVAFFKLGCMVVAIFPKRDLAADAGVEYSSGGFPGFSLSYNTSGEDEVNTVIERLRNSGTRIVKEPQSTEWGGYSAYFADPDGYLWEVVYNPFWHVASDGRVESL